MGGCSDRVPRVDEASQRGTNGSGEEVEGTWSPVFEKLWHESDSFAWNSHMEKRWSSQGEIQMSEK